MAKYEDYVKKDSEEVKIDAEVVDASKQQEERTVSTPDVDWKKRYDDLEISYSRQGNQLGDYRKLVDDFISTPAVSQEDSVEAVPITPNDIYENPAEAVNRAVEAHPAIQEARELKEDLEEQKANALKETFDAAHPNYQETATSPEFGEWVRENPTRLDLVQRASKFDMISADALFTLWEAEQAAKQTLEETQAATQIDAVNLESGAGAEPPAPERFSRSEMLEQKIRAKQGVQDSIRYVKQHQVAYREALAQGNVRD